VSKRLFTQYHKKYSVNFLKEKYKLIANEYQNIGKAKFTPEDDKKISQLVASLGFNWAKISMEFKDKTPLMLKNRYYHMKRKGLLPDTGEEEEEEI